MRSGARPAPLREDRETGCATETPVSRATRPAVLRSAARSFRRRLPLGRGAAPGALAPGARRRRRRRVKALVGPRRIALSSRSPPVAERATRSAGPPSRSPTEDGKPTKAAEGFARGLGLPVDELELATATSGGRAAGPPRSATGSGRSCAARRGKTMRWGPKSDQVRFPRPIRWLCAKLDGETIEVGPGRSWAGARSATASRRLGRDPARGRLRRDPAGGRRRSPTRTSAAA